MENIIKIYNKILLQLLNILEKLNRENKYRIRRNKKKIEAKLGINYY